MPSRHVYPFEKLRVWESARQLGANVYGLTRAFPRSESYGLTSQTNRAAVSIAANFAEESALREEIESVSRQLSALRNTQLSS